MSILVRGMEMPTSCADCRFCNGQANTDYGVCAWCNVDGKARDAYTRQDCPLVPVPEHGRLIDADALENRVVPASRFFEIPNANVVVLGAIKAAPTIIPASEEGE